MKKPAAYALKKPENRGFTLLELAVVLLISAVIGLALWKLLPAMRGSANADTPRMTLRAAQDALDGFVLREHRLPCPAAMPTAASASNGIEDCSASRQVGSLPYATLGLAASDLFLTGTTLRYGVYRNAAATSALDADLALAKPRFDPLTPVSVRGATNGLDFCVGFTTVRLIS
jgi:prepilin-type N-terminal cleavage/methylation domain-containing protein